MPGIFGAFQKGHARQTLPELMRRMAASMENGAPLVKDYWVDEGGGVALGHAGLGILNQESSPVVDSTGNYRIVLHGEIYDLPSHTASAPEHVLRLYLNKGNACASELSGVFHCAIHNRLSGEIKLFSDKFGLLPLYYSVLPEGFVFGAEVKALLQYRRVGRDVHYRSLGDFLHFGQILGQKTLFESVSLLAPGSVLTFSPETGSAIVELYWKLHEIFSQDRAYRTSLSTDDVVSLLVDSIRGKAVPGESVGLSLSGGLDSRAILAGLGTEAKGMHTYTLGLPGCADQKLTEQLAQIAGTRHEFVPLDRSYLQDFQQWAGRMVHLSDGMYPPHESTEMLALEYFKRAPFKILLRGHGGEIAKAALAYPVMVKPEVHAFTRGEQTLDYIFHATNFISRDIELSRLLSPRVYEQVRDAARDSLVESCGEISEILSPVDTCIYYYTNEHVRRQVVASLEIFRSQIEIRMPFVDESYLKALLELPPSRRNAGEIQIALVKKCMPELVKVPNSNTGAPLDAGALRLWATDKFASALRRLKFKGFRHYTEFEDWQRKDFRQATETILFSTRLRDRGIYDPVYLRALFDRHVAGERDYARLIGTIVGLELWFRAFVDK